MEAFIAPVRDATDAPVWYHETDAGSSGAVWAGLIHNKLGNVSDCEACPRYCHKLPFCDQLTMLFVVGVNRVSPM